MPQDPGIIRACNAVYKRNPKLSKNSKAILFVSRLDKDVTEKVLEKVASFGSCSSLPFILTEFILLNRFSAGMDL